MPNELPAHFISEPRSFFEDYKKLEKKIVLVEDFLGKDMAIQNPNDAFKLHQEKFVKYFFYHFSSTESYGDDVNAPKHGVVFFDL